MNHADVKSCLADYLEGDLSLDRRARVDAHLDACGQCAAEVDQMRRMIRLLRLLPEPETPPMIAANVMRRIRAGESRPGLVERFSHAVGGILDPGFVLPAAVIASAALVLVVWRDPSFFRQGSLVPRLEAGLETTGVGPFEMDASRAGSEPRGAGFEPERGRVFGAPAARDFRMAAQGSDLRSMQGQPDPARRVGPTQTRILIQLEPAGPRGSVFHQDPLLAPLGSSSFGMLETSFGGGVVQAPSAWQEAGRRAPVPREARFSSTSVDPTAAVDSAAGPSSGSTSEVDKRDEWIARAIGDPTGFARFLESQNLAEQELWVARLRDRAQARGLLESLVTRLRTSGDSSAALFAEDFAAEVSDLGGDAAGTPGLR